MEVQEFLRERCKVTASYSRPGWALVDSQKMTDGTRCLSSFSHVYAKPLIAGDVVEFDGIKIEAMRDLPAYSLQAMQSQEGRQRGIRVVRIKETEAGGDVWYDVIGGVSDAIKVHAKSAGSWHYWTPGA